MKEKIIMWGAIIGLGILLFLIPTKGNALTKVINNGKVIH